MLDSGLEPVATQQFNRDLLPHLGDDSLAPLSNATSLSQTYCSFIKRGLRRSASASLGGAPRLRECRAQEWPPLVFAMRLTSDVRANSVFSPLLRSARGQGANCCQPVGRIRPCSTSNRWRICATPSRRTTCWIDPAAQGSPGIASRLISQIGPRACTSQRDLDIPTIG